MHHILLMETLQRAGLDINKDVTLKRIDFFDMGQALSGGQIDAFCSGEPYPSIEVAQGDGKVLEYPYYDEKDYSGDVLYENLPISGQSPQKRIQSKADILALLFDN